MRLLPSSSRLHKKWTPTSVESDIIILNYYELGEIKRKGLIEFFSEKITKVKKKQIIDY
jgi:hypothetical protein